MDRREGDERRSEDKGLQWTEWVKWLVPLVLAGIVGYSSSNNAMNARLSVLESKQQGIEQRLDRMENKIDILVSRGQ